MFDLLIKNAFVLDGSGKKMFRGDVAVKKDVIVKVGDLANARAIEEIDAADLYLAPGFIDILNHSDSYLTLLSHPEFESLITQGVTTILLGHCGSSLAPLGSELLDKTISKWASFFRTIVLPPRQSGEAIKSLRRWADIRGVNLNWITVSEFLTEIEEKKIAVNFGTLVGHSTVRRNLTQDDERILKPEELKHFGSIIDEAISDGAFGLSTGLTYAHSYYVPTEEIIELAKTAALRETKYFTHLREEGHDLPQGVVEAIKIGREAQVGVEVSHLVAHRDFTAQFEESLELLNRAYQEGLEINFDFYPYDYSWSILYTYLPRYAYQGSREDLLKRLRDPKTYQKILLDFQAAKKDLLDLTIAYAPFNKTYVGRKIEDIARLRRISQEEAVLETLKGCQGHVICFNSQENEALIQEAVKHPLSMVASGSAGYSPDYEKEGQLIHPRCFGTFPRFLGRYVREKKLLNFEKAIQKITSLPALKIGLADRGFIEEGFKADLVLFNPKTIIDRATYDNPFIYSKGVEYVVVNGKVVLKKGRVLPVKAGKAIKK